MHLPSDPNAHTAIQVWYSVLPLHCFLGFGLHACTKYDYRLRKPLNGVENKKQNASLDKRLPQDLLENIASIFVSLERLIFSSMITSMT